MCNTPLDTKLLHLAAGAPGTTEPCFGSADGLITTPTAKCSSQHKYLCSDSGYLEAKR